MPLTLRSRFILYWLTLHVIFAVSMGVLLRNEKVWLLAVEALLAVSLIVALRLLSRLYRPLQLVQQGAELIRDNYANASFQLTGHQEIDIVLKAYNLMLESLRKERLRMQEQHFLLEKVITASPSGIITLDFDNRVTMANPKAGQLLGLSSSGLLGLPLTALTEPFGKVLTDLTEGESELVRLANREVIRCSRSSFFDQGFSRGFLLLEEMTEEVRASEKAAFEKAIRILSHEVNNSIGAANSLLHSLLHYKQQLHPGDQPDFEMALQVVISRTEHLNRFMRSYMNVVRLPDPILEPVDFFKLVQESVILFDAELNSNHISVDWSWQVAPDLLIRLDPGQIGQVLVNVLKNAIEAIGNHGSILVSLKQSGTTLQFEIADSGSGIREDVQQQLFSPFFSTRPNGQGIGLTLVQEILQRHHFAFNLENREEGGAVFRISIPAN